MRYNAAESQLELNQRDRMRLGFHFPAVALLEPEDAKGVLGLIGRSMRELYEDFSLPSGPLPADASWTVRREHRALIYMAEMVLSHLEIPDYSNST
jgi:hypothetical protein